MNASKALLASALGAVVAMGALSATRPPPQKRKMFRHCPGWQERLRLRCPLLRRPGHQGQDPGDWKYVAKGSCEKMGGKLAK
jgi:uncharacterized membrane protein